VPDYRVADNSYICQENTDKLFDVFYVFQHNRGMKRYQTLENATCLLCEAWLSVMVGTYTGEIVCSECGANNIYRDSKKPVECGFPSNLKGLQGTDAESGRASDR
jgi:hypothetical protein